MKIKDKKAFFTFLLLVVVIWQLCISLSKIICSPFFKGDIEGLFEITQVTNNGAAFGMFENNSYILGVLGVLVVAGVFAYVLKNYSYENKRQILYSSIFTAGILGNTIERLTSGCVFDFIKITAFEFPVFNLFDVLISFSCVLFVISYIREEIIKRAGN